MFAKIKDIRSGKDLVDNEVCEERIFLRLPNHPRGVVLHQGIKSKLKAFHKVANLGHSTHITYIKIGRPVGIPFSRQIIL